MDTITLYHGTTTKHLPSILEHGLLPRRSKKSNWPKGGGQSRKDLVYLTTCYAAYYGFSACKTKGEKPVIIKIELPLDEYERYQQIFPDEEFLFHALSPKPTSYESINPRFYSEHWRKSLDFMGTVAVSGVPTKHIVGYHIGDSMDFIRHCDPSVSPMNYRYCSGMYIDHLNSLEFTPVRS